MSNQAVALFDDVITGIDTAKTEVAKVLHLLPEDSQAAITAALGQAANNVVQAATAAATQITSPTTAPTVVVSSVATAVLGSTKDALGNVIYTAEHALANDLQTALDNYILANGGLFGPEIETVVNNGINYGKTVISSYVTGILKGKAAQATPGLGAVAINNIGKVAAN